VNTDHHRRSELRLGFRPELWCDIVPDDAPPGVKGFNNEIRGTEGSSCLALNMIAGMAVRSAYDVIFDMAARSSVTRRPASLGEETSSWSYRHDRDLTASSMARRIRPLLDAPIAALLPEGAPGAAGTVLLLQKWKHKVAEWEALPVDQQERIMGRTKLDSIELETAIGLACRPHRSGRVGDIFRRNMPYGNSVTTARCSLDSAQSRSGFPECSTALAGWSLARAMRSHALLSR